MGVTRPSGPHGCLIGFSLSHGCVTVSLLRKAHTVRNAMDRNSACFRSHFFICNMVCRSSMANTSVGRWLLFLLYLFRPLPYRLPQPCSRVHISQKQQHFRLRRVRYLPPVFPSATKDLPPHVADEKYAKEILTNRKNPSYVVRSATAPSVQLMTIIISTIPY